MTEIERSRRDVRRAASERAILDAAWVLMRREGVAAVSVREVARAVGLRQQSLTHYFATKQALLDALFVDGFRDLRSTLERLSRSSDAPDTVDPVEAVVRVAVTVVEYFVTHPARYHLMLQRSVPGFEPTDASHDVALGTLRILRDALSAAGITEAGDVALVRSLISGIAAEQTANDPHGRLYLDQAGRGVRMLLHDMRGRLAVER